MTGSDPTRTPPHGGPPSPPPGLDRRFEAIVFDWDGTAVADRRADATRLRALVEDLCGAGTDLIVVSGTSLANVDGQLGARPAGPGRLFMCLGRGSEAYEVDWRGARPVHRRGLTAAEDRRLSAAASLAASRLAARGLTTEVIDRPDRRKVDLIPVADWADPPKAVIGDLLDAVERRLRAAGIGSLREAADVVRDAASDAGLPDARLTSDAKHVEIGLTDKADSARWAFRTLWERGIGPGLVLVAGDEFGALGGLPGSDSLLLVPEATRATVLSVGVEPGGVAGDIVWLPRGPAAFLDVLADQLRRRTERVAPDIDRDPLWTYCVQGSGEDERAQEAMLTLGDGRFGTAGAPLDDHPGTMPRVLAAGVYVGEGPESTLLQAPLWDRSAAPLRRPQRLTRTLDLHTGVLLEESTDGRLHRRALRFASLARPGTVALRIDGAAPLMPVGQPLSAPLGGTADDMSGDGRQCMSAAGVPGGVVVAASECRTADTRGWRADRLAAYVADPGRMPSTTDAITALEGAEAAGFDHLLVEHRAAWAARWADADIRIEGDDALQHAVRVALFHLMASVASSGEASVGARGVSGTAYRGHVFWDSDVFVLPFLAATHPEAARAMLEYRVRRTPAATAAAAALGRAGARFPWESAWSGSDVTPRWFHDHTGELVEIRTGDLEEHIVADVAWAADAYLAWTGDRDLADGPAGTLFTETARYWSSRATLGDDGRAHILGVTGPDEYHEAVDDNAFTNVMARWNLRRAASLGASDPAEQAGWRWLARHLVDGYDRRTRLYEQFAGFWDLEPLVIARMASRRPVAADVLLGRERVAGAQVVKQADVLMLHYLIPESTRAGSLEPNLDHYEPRTAHGSSLSPGVHAALFARAGRPEAALDTLRLASRLDLDDVTRTTAGGVHLAAMGSVWQAVVWGIAGIRPTRQALQLDPRLPPGWSGLEIPVRYRGARVRIRIEPDAATIETDRPLRVRLASDRSSSVPPGITRMLLARARRRRTGA